MHRIVHLCAPALQLSTFVSMRHAHSIHLVCVGNLKVYVVNPIRKLCFELSNALLPPSHALYFRKCPSSENGVERIQLQVMKWMNTHMCMDNKGMFCELVSSNALDTASAFFMHACQMKTNWCTKVQTKCRPNVDQAQATLWTKPTAKQLPGLWLGLQGDLHLVHTWSAPLSTNGSLCDMPMQFINVYLKSHVHFMIQIHTTHLKFKAMYESIS